MESKALYESKSVWAGGLLVLFGVWNAIFNQNIDPYPILTGLGIIGIRQAVD